MNLVHLVLLSICYFQALSTFSSSLIQPSYGPAYETLYSCDNTQPGCEINACGNASFFVTFNYTVPLSGLYTFATNQAPLATCPNTVLFLENSSYSLCNNDMSTYITTSMIQSYFAEGQDIKIFVGSQLNLCPFGFSVGFRVEKAETLLPFGYIPPTFFTLYSCDSNIEATCADVSCGGASQFTVVSYEIRYNATFTFSTEVLSATCNDTVLFIRSSSFSSYCGYNYQFGANLVSKITQDFSDGEVLTILLGSPNDSCVAGTDVGLTISKSTFILQLPSVESIDPTYQPLYSCDTSEELCNVQVCGAGGSRFVVYNYTIPSSGIYTFATDNAPQSTCYDTILIVRNATSQYCDDNGGEEWFSLLQAYFNAGDTVLAYVASYHDTCTSGSLVALRIIKLESLPSLESISATFPLYSCDSSIDSICNFTSSQICGGATKYVGLAYDVPISGYYNFYTSSASCPDTVLLLQIGDQVLCNDNINAKDLYSLIGVSLNALTIVRIFIGSHNNECAAGTQIVINIGKSSPVVIVDLPSQIDINPTYQTLYSCDTTLSLCNVTSCSLDGAVSTQYVVYEYIVPVTGTYIFATNDATNATCIDTLLVVETNTQYFCDDDYGGYLTSLVKGDFKEGAVVKAFVGSYDNRCRSGLTVALRVQGVNVTYYPSVSPTSSPLTPSVSPSSSPSNSPQTNAPSTSPTNSPTKSPLILLPSQLPTFSPLHPSASPVTSNPSISPTISPSGSPTFIPSMNPTLTPTTSHPTNDPTVLPSSSPIFSPSSSPTHQPIITNSPSHKPSQNPTPPTLFPTKSPTVSKPFILPSVTITYIFGRSSGRLFIISNIA